MTMVVKFITWLRRYWYIPFVTLGAALSYVFLMRRRATPMAQTKAELEAIRMASNVAKIEALLGAENAREVVEREYRETLGTLNEQQKKKAMELRDDPAKLAKFLVRAGNTSN